MDSPFQLEDQQILEEDYDESYEPTEDEVLEYCKVLGLDPVTERDLLYIAKEGIKAPLPTNWKPVEDQTGNVYYFNFGTGDSTWEHPCDEFYRKLLEQERDKRSNKPTEQTDGMLSKGKKKGVTLKGRGGRQNGVNNGLPMRNGGQHQQAPLRKLPNMNGSPPHGKLAPLSMGKPLPSIGGLPPLKPPSTLAPLRPPPSLAGTLSSTGGSSRGTERLGVSGGEGVDLLGSVRISTQFEEEDTESESVSRGGGFKTKLNLLGAEDLGLQISDEELDSTEDVSKELRQIMDISSDRDNSEHSVRPQLRPSAPLPPPKALGESPLSSLHRSGGVGESPLSSLHRGGGVGESPVSSLHRGGGVGESPVSSPRFLRPGGARVRSGSSSPLSTSSPVQPPRSKSLSIPTTTAAAAGRLGGTGQQDVLSREHDVALKQLREKHESELKQTMAELTETLEETQASLASQNERKLTSFREQLAREQLSEEKRLRCESDAALAEVRVRVCEEREDQEARLEEDKVDYLRKMRLQLSNEREREENILKEDSKKTLNQLRGQHQQELSKTEAEIRSQAETEIKALRERLTREVAVERESVQDLLEGELEAVRSGKDVQLTERKEEIESNHQKQLEQLEQLREKHEQEYQSALADIEASNKLDQAKSESLQTHQQSLEELQTQFSAELDNQRGELKSKHEQEMEKLSCQYERELTQTKEEWAEKISSERQRLSAEFETVKTSLHQEHEVIVHSLESKLQAAQADLEAQAQHQSEELTSLQSEHAAKVSELTSLREQLSLEETTLTQQRADLETLRINLASERSDLDREQAELETYRTELASQRGKVDRGLAQKHTREGRDGQAAAQRERESLAQLQRSHKNLKEDILKLQQQKETVQSSLDQLLRTQEEVKGQVSALKNEEPTINGGSGGMNSNPSDNEGGGMMDMRELDPPTHTGGHTYTHTDAVRGSKVAGPRESKQRAHKRHSRPHTTTDYDDGNLSLLQEIRDKLDQEAVVLSQLEEKMLSSGTQQRRGDTALGRQLEDPSDEDSPFLPPTDVPSPKTYLSKLQASLDKSRRYTQPSPRVRHQSSPLPNHTLINTSSDSEDDTTLQSSTNEVQTRGTKFSSSTRRILSDGGGTERKTKRTDTVDSDKTQQNMIFQSLSMINSQLGQLLVRLPDTPHTPHAPHISHTPTQSHGYDASGGATNTRWAEPVIRSHDQTEWDLADKRRSYLGARPTVSTGSTVLSHSHLVRSGRLPPSTEQLIHNQTDWLKEFRQSIPLNHHRPPTTSTLPGHHRPPTALPPGAGPNLLPRKHKLVLDHGNNVKLMHI